MNNLEKMILKLVIPVALLADAQQLAQLIQVIYASEEVSQMQIHVTMIVVMAFLWLPLIAMI